MVSRGLICHDVTYCSMTFVSFINNYHFTYKNIIDYEKYNLENIIIDYNDDPIEHTSNTTRTSIVNEIINNEDHYDHHDHHDHTLCDT